MSPVRNAGTASIGACTSVGPGERTSAVGPTSISCLSTGTRACRRSATTRTAALNRSRLRPRCELCRRIPPRTPRSSGSSSRATGLPTRTCVTAGCCRRRARTSAPRTSTSTSSRAARRPPGAAGGRRAAGAGGVVLGGGWDDLLREELDKPYWSALLDFVAREHEDHEVYPPWPQTFKAFELTSCDDVKVVILGQDPYINPGQAHGLAFSVPAGVAIPPSLRNIRKELAADLGISLSDLPDHGDLTAWAEQGVLLLNTTLTVRRGESNSHEGMGWETFTDAVISAISAELEGVVFILWGGPAQKKAKTDRPDATPSADHGCSSESSGKRPQPASRVEAVHDSQQAPDRRRPDAGGLVTPGPDPAG